MPVRAQARITALEAGGWRTRSRARAPPPLDARSLRTYTSALPNLASLKFSAGGAETLLPLVHAAQLRQLDLVVADSSPLLTHHLFSGFASLAHLHALTLQCPVVPVWIRYLAHLRLLALTLADASADLSALNWLAALETFEFTAEGERHSFGMLRGETPGGGGAGGAPGLRSLRTLALRAPPGRHCCAFGHLRGLLHALEMEVTHLCAADFQPMASLANLRSLEVGAGGRGPLLCSSSRF